MTSPVGRFDPATGLWVLTEPWQVEVQGDQWTILPGMESDGASIPRFLWPVVGPRIDAKTFAAAFLHDTLYAVQGTSRKYADDRFRFDLRAAGVRRSKATAYWLAVRLFGWYPWGRKSPESIALARDLLAIG